MKEKFESELSSMQNRDVFLSIRIAGEKTFPRKFRIDKAIPTKPGLIFWSLHLEKRAYLVRHKLKHSRKAQEMEMASALVKNKVQKNSSQDENRLVNMIELIYSRMPNKLLNYHLPYTYQFLSNLLSSKYDSPILPQMLLKALPRIFPENTPPKGLSSWDDIISWSDSLWYEGDDLERQNSESFDNKNLEKEAKRKSVASRIIYPSVATLKRFRHYNATTLDWNWCPFCWRPVKNSSGRKRCKIHKNGKPEYQKLLRILRKIKQTQPKIPGIPLGDRIPINLRQRYQEQAQSAFNSGFPKGWKYLPITKKYLEKNNTNVSISNIDKCIEILSPGALNLFKRSTIELVESGTLQIRDDKESEIERYLNALRESFLTRVETWLSLTANVKRGGSRQIAETEQEKRKRFRKIGSALKEKRLQRKLDQL